MRIPRPGLCTDNGAMVAALGWLQVEAGVIPSALDLGAQPGARGRRGPAAMSEPAGDGRRWLMWEAKAADAAGAALLAWVLEHAPPAGQVYRSADRVVLITRGLRRADIADPPAELLARPCVLMVVRARSLMGGTDLFALTTTVTGA